MTPYYHKPPAPTENILYDKPLAQHDVAIKPKDAMSDKKVERECQKMINCRNILRNKLKIEEEYLDHSFNRCYCENCYNGEKCCRRGIPEEKYVIPSGWCGFGVKIDPRMNKKKIKEIFDGYHVAYHGTYASSVNSILIHGFGLPGDELIKKNIQIRKGHIPEENQIFTSPSPEYASLAQIYAPEFRFKGKKYKVMLQVRQHPSSYVAQPETVGGLCTTEKYIPQDRIEWKTKKRDAIIPIRILIKQIMTLPKKKGK